MGEHLIKMPDIGEGVAEAELVEWAVDVGAQVREDDVLAAVMTDKATVEIPAPMDGKITWLGADVGDTVAIGAAIIRMEVAGEGNVKPGTDPADVPETPVAQATRVEVEQIPNSDPVVPSAPKVAEQKATPAPASSVKPVVGVRTPPGQKPLAAPSVRRRAMEAGLDLRTVPGSGPAGRISHEDLDAYLNGNGQAGTIQQGRIADTSIKEIKLVGMRRKIAEQMVRAKSSIPHITYVDDVDVTALEDLRAQLNADAKPDQARITILPFLMRAMARAIQEQPLLNSRFDEEAGIIHQYGGIHMGIAAQTDAGLVVPVVRHVETLNLRACAAEVTRLSEAAKAGAASRDELSGSTITITSLGKLGGIVTTPVINHPEVAIIGVNKMRVMPVWKDGEFVPRKMMNLSSSFDHRIIDGWDAAVFIQRIKGLLESPATIFIED
ncbi:MAG: dihydrolipoamide acetyltransferase family protein [Pseudomonadota bacterium]